MIDGLGPYGKMKRSGVPWLGEVPAHWEVLRLGQFGRLSKGNGGNKEDEVPAGVPCIRYGDLYTTHTYFIRESRSFVSSERAKDYTRIRLGDVLFAASGETIDEIGKSAVNLMESHACCGGDVIIFRPEGEISPRFLGYATDCPAAAAQKATMGRGITVKHIYGDELKRLAIALPPSLEQAAIVRFLDDADRRIRHYIRAKRKLIKLMEEQKRAVIHCAVTRGLNSSVCLKPSGVEWLGDVPEHWEVVPNRSLLRLQKRLVGKASDDYLLLSLTKQGIIARDMENPEGKFPANFEAYQAVSAGDLVFCLFDIDETPRAVGVARTDGMITGAYTRFACDRSVVEWVYLFYLAMDNGKRLKPLYRGLRKVINKTTFLSAKMPLPPAAERAEILAEVEASRRVADDVIGRARHEISLLDELRTRLIADVVTGKLDVREAAARLPDEVEDAEPLDESVELTETDEELADEFDAGPDEDAA